MIKKIFARCVPFALILLPLAGCSPAPDGTEAEHSEGAEAPEGPHGGRLLTDGDLGLEITIFETGQEPQFRVYPYWQGEELDPAKVNLQITLSRLGGKVDRFTFTAQDDFLAAAGVVEEPHSFDVEVVASVDGKRSRWTYENHEGRTTISPEAAEQGGIAIATAGPATIGDTRELFGTVELNPSARSEIRGQFPGRVVSVTKQVGDTVRSGELLARMESSESLQIYPVYSTVSGVVAERGGNPGDMTHDAPLYVITNPSATTVVFNIFPRDLGIIRPGMRVEVQSQDGRAVGATTLGQYLAEGNPQAGTALVRAAIPNRGGWIRPGMTMRGRVIINAETVPLAVRTEAIQPFRDFQVVYARYGDEYEVRMLQLGRRGAEYTEVLSGIEPGTPYVTEGSFLVRADVEKSGASHDH
ncbi:MAG: HlyD family efflux transporter periplasmic adaptor subunit [Altererythrobacter sp.]|uniref:efflux RND transporter periplasmic adaptor subunit n=1 Tax=uncultured Erythrobacter sp. TaxID=263913 RepID=UPI001826BDD7|nr:efflux RND transporter periplasmic adaptor subunit [uncultured Erythrobacter sp.]NNF94930.1 HlyD family efflux transporter periplasmic adaptor subunit [Altererythrobacter sp.]